MNLIEIIKQDYKRFPYEQTYDIYDREVYFRDPLNEFRGCDRYRQNIEFITRWFRNVQLDLHGIEREGDRIVTRWTLSWNAPLPWQPRIAIPGWSELTVNAEGKIDAHIDYWHCSRRSVLAQHFRG